MILWRGETGCKLTQLSTDHQGNIFSVKFIPHTGDSAIVTGKLLSLIFTIWIVGYVLYDINEFV